MLNFDNLALSSLRAAVKKVVEIVVSLRGQWWALPLTDEVGIWNPLDCGMLGIKLPIVDEAQLVGYQLELASSWLLREAGIQ